MFCFRRQCNKSRSTEMRLLELFSGTGSVGLPFKEAGHEVISIDIDPRYEPTICDDIFNIDYTILPIPDVIWASPPCDQYARCRTRGPPRNFKLADSLVARAIEIIEFSKFQIRTSFGFWKMDTLRSSGEGMLPRI